MARIRTIKPEFAADEKLATISRDARLTFLMVISQADDEGLLAAAPRQLLGTLYPLDETVTTEILADWIAELVAIGRLAHRRTRDGSPILEVVNWSKHQRIDKPTPSKIKPVLAKPSREAREEVASVQRIEVEVGSGIRSGAVNTDPVQGEARPHSRVENPGTTSAPPVACATGNGNSGTSRGTAPLPFHAAKLLRSCYGTAPQRRQDDVTKQLVATLRDGAAFERGEKVKAVDVDHLDDVCRRVLAKPIEKPDAAIRLVLIKLRDSFGETKVAREKATRPTEPPRRRQENSGPTPIGDVIAKAVA